MSWTEQEDGEEKRGGVKKWQHTGRKKGKNQVVISKVGKQTVRLSYTGTVVR